MTRDILEGSVKWRGLGVINPFGPDGKLVSLKSYPKLAAYLERHGAAIKARHVSKKNPQRWYRTIDRIYPELTYVPKLLIPDIKGEAHIVYEPGKLYPHHNLYFVTATDWDLRALQAVLLSDVTRMFITLYSTKMRGGYLRFQAQYLRRLRVPHWRDVPAALRAELIKAGKSRDAAACNAAAAALYKLTPIERQALADDRGVRRCRLILPITKTRPGKRSKLFGATARRRSRSKRNSGARTRANAPGSRPAKTWTGLSPSFRT